MTDAATGNPQAMVMSAAFAIALVIGAINPNPAIVESALVIASVSGTLMITPREVVGADVEAIASV